MHARIDPPKHLLEIAASQAGIINAGQALSCGMSRPSIKRLVDQGSWQRVTTGVYLLGAGTPSWLGLAWAGILLGGPESRLGFASAGHLWEIIPEQPGPIRVLIPSTAALRPRSGPWTFLRERPGVREQRSPGSPARTTIEDTVLDLCDEATADRVINLVTAAIQTQRTTAARLLVRARQRARVRHRRLLENLLVDVTEGAESALEISYVRDVERRHQLPRATRQVRSRKHRAVRDLIYEEFGVLVELDGQTHLNKRFRDMRRDNSALLDGELTLRYGWQDVSGRPCEVAWQVAGLLCRRGWTGMPVRCSWCKLSM